MTSGHIRLQQGTELPGTIGSTFNIHTNRTIRATESIQLSGEMNFPYNIGQKSRDVDWLRASR